MKQLLIILVILISGATTCSAQYKTCDPDQTEYAEAECLDEVVYDRNGIPVNCPANKFRKFKRQRQREYAKYHGTRFIDRAGRSFVGLGRGFVKFCAYIGAATVITIGTIWVLEKTSPS